MSLVYCSIVVSVLFCSSFILAKPTQSVHNDKVQIVKQKILSSLGYKEPPVIRNISTSIQEQRDMIRKYKEHVSKTVIPDEEHHPETIASYHAEGPIKVVLDESQPASKILINFDVREKHPDDPHMETVISRAHIKLKLKSSNSSTQIRIHTETNNDVSNLYNNEFVFSAVQRSTDVVYLDISSLLRGWLDNPTKHFKVILSFSTNVSDVLNLKRNHFLDSSQNLDFEAGMEPVLEVFSYEKSILGREKRQADITSRRDCVKGDGENRCCRFRTYISFADIGWDNWIIKPSGYEAYYCDGECPHRFKMANTFAGIKSLLHLKNPSTFSPPCCVPSKLSPFTILHKEENGRYAFMDLDDMIVTDCKCA